MKRPKVGPLFQNVGFDQRGEASDGAGGTTAVWAEIFSARAVFQHLRGGESVMAARLENKHPMIVTVRTSSLAKTVSSDWRMTNKRTLETYNIRDVTVREDRRYIDFLVESGPADG